MTWSIARGIPILLSAMLAAASNSGAADSFRDCAVCPEMRTIPAGKTMLGAAHHEEVAEKVPTEWRGFARQRVIEIKAIAVSIYPVTVHQFAAFAAESERNFAGCVELRNGNWHFVPTAAWNAVNFPQNQDHPVVCVNFDDALAYAEWLSKRTGQKYRLLTEDEWEHAARAGSTTRRYWGDDSLHSEQCRFANGADLTFLEAQGTNSIFPSFNEIPTRCHDEYVHTSPVGHFQPNAFGLHDMIGNVMEWTSSCFSRGDEDLAHAIDRSCGTRVLKGGSWADPPWSLRAADRYRDIRENRCMGVGFRVAREL